MKYLVHDTNGQILRYGHCQSETLALQAGENEIAIEISVDIDENHYIDEGVIVNKQIKPSTNHIFDYTAKEWIDQRTLEDIQQAKWNEIKSIRDTKEFGAFTYNGMVFDGDENAQRRLSGYISVSKSAIQSNTPFSANFILKDNSVVTLTASDFVGIELAKITQVAQAFDISTTLRAAIYAATTAEAIDLIAWLE